MLGFMSPTIMAVIESGEPALDRVVIAIRAEHRAMDATHDVAEVRVGFLPNPSDVRGAPGLPVSAPASAAASMIPESALPASVPPSTVPPSLATQMPSISKTHSFVHITLRLSPGAQREEVRLRVAGAHSPSPSQADSTSQSQVVVQRAICVPQLPQDSLALRADSLDSA